jgi:hypothetical protein
MILKIFSTKNLAKTSALFAKTTTSFCNNVIISLVFKKNAFFRRKLTKIANITSTPGQTVPLFLRLLGTGFGVTFRIEFFQDEKCKLITFFRHRPI